MNKQILLMTMVLFLIVITLVVGSIDASTTSNIFLNTVPQTVENVGFFARLFRTATLIFSYLTIFFRILSFQVTGIPPIFNVLVFYPLTIGTIGLLIDILKP